MLASRDVLRGARVLDAYAGSGALGLEALSRGAASALFIEADKATAGIIGRNIAALGLAEVASVRPVRVAVALDRPASARFDLVLADPPYPMGEEQLSRDLALIVAQGWFATNGLLVVERSTRSPQPSWPEGLVGEDCRRYGETALWFASPDVLAPE